MSTQNAANDLVPPLDTTSTSIAQPYRNIGWGLWLKWTLATAVGWAIGIIVYSVFQFTLTTVFASILAGLLLMSFGAVIGGAFGGIIAVAFGFTQGLLLKQHGYSIRQYTKASFIGGIIGGALSAVIIFLLLFVSASSLMGQLTGVVLMGVAGAITGAIIGYMQKNLLQEQGLGIKRWILFNAAAWGIGCATSEIVVEALNETLWPFLSLFDRSSPVYLAVIMLAVLCGLVGGAITGYPLMRALQQSPIQNPKSEIQNESSSPHLG